MYDTPKHKWYYPRWHLPCVYCYGMSTMLLSLKNKHNREETCVSQKIKSIFCKIIGLVGIFRENKVINVHLLNISLLKPIGEEI